MNITSTRDVVVALDLELAYEERMELIRMLASGGPNGAVLRLQTYQSHLTTQANISMNYGLGVGATVTGVAIKTTNEVPA